MWTPINVIAHIHFHLICQVLLKYSGVESERTASRFRRKKRKICAVFSYFIKRACEIRKEMKRNVQKTAMHLQSCCFAFYPFSLLLPSSLLKLPIVVIQNFCYHGYVTSHFSLLPEGRTRSVEKRAHSHTIRHLVKLLILYPTFSIYTRACVLLTGSQKERDAVEFANKFSTRRELDIYKADKEDVQFSLQVADDIDIGDSFDVKVVVQNKSNEKRTVKLNITSCLAFYTGMPARELKKKKKTLHLAGKEGTVTPC